MEKSEEKVDVPLKWMDFVRAFKEIHYNRHSESTRDRDWFKLNPMDIFLCGCQAIGTQKAVLQKMNNLTIYMENIFPKLCTQPRIAIETVDLLLHLIVCGNDANTFLCKRLISILCDICNASLTHPLLHFWLHPFLLRKFEEKKYCDRLTSLKCGEDFVNGFKNKKLSTNYDVNATLKEFKIFENHVFSVHLLNDYCSPQDVSKTFNNTEVSKMLNFLQEHCNNNKCTETFLQLLALILFAQFNRSLNDDEDDVISTDIVDKLTDDTRTQSKEGNSPTLCKRKTSSTAGFFLWLHSCLVKLSEDFRDDLTDVMTNLFSYLLLELTSRYEKVNNMKSLYEQKQLDIVITSISSYAKDFGKSCGKVLVHLLSFLSSGVEMEMQRIEMVAVKLPNILAIGFGFKDEEIVCLLLQLGTSALYSKYRDELLSKSLHFIVSLHRLFLTDEEVKYQNSVLSKRVEALAITQELLGELIDRSLASSGTIDIFSQKNAPKGIEISEKTDDSSLLDATNCKSIDHNKLSLSEPDEKLVDVTVKDKRSDDGIQIIILTKLLKLSCCMIKSNENISYTFACLLPKLFYRTDYPDVPEGFPVHLVPDFTKRKSLIPWRIRKHALAVDVLDLCINCYERNLNSTFRICGVMIPKLAANLNYVRIPDLAKFNILREFVHFCDTKVKTSDHINSLVTHGLDLISQLMPTENINEKTVKVFINQVTNSIEKLGHTSSLLFMKTSCEFLQGNIPSEKSDIKVFFLSLLKKCNRNDIRNVFLLARPWIVQNRFREVRAYLYSYMTGRMKSKQLQLLTELLTTLISVEEKIQKDCLGQTHLVQYEEMQDVIQDNFKSKRHAQILQKLSRISLYHVLLPAKVSEKVCCGSESLEDKTGWIEDLDARIPSVILNDEKTMILLQSVARRIDQMQVPRYQSLKGVLVELLQDFITNAANEDDNADDNIATRKSTFHKNIFNLSWNVQKRETLIQKYGYKETLWTEPLLIEVQTTGELNLEENLRQTLLSCYREYSEILNVLNVANVVVDGATIKTDDIFNDELPLSELKGRRSIVLKAIDKHSGSDGTNILEKRSTLLMREEQIENDFDKMASKHPSPQTFIVRLNHTFLDCACCCGPNIVGCYSSQGGEHCERPLEIGFRADSAFVSIYHEGIEIENCELLYTDQGVFCYKSYSSGHPYDTADVWFQFFIEILEKKDYIPALILPYHFPNRSTWEATRRFASPDVVSTFITCDFDYSPEWRTYYDFRPETVGNGKDIILSKGFTNKERRTSFSFQRQISVNVNKDLAGVLCDKVMQNLLEDTELEKFKFLGKHFLVMLNHFVDTGVWNVSLLENNFQFDRWKKNHTEYECKSKDFIIGTITEFVWNKVEESLMDFNLLEMLRRQTRQFHQLRFFLEKHSKAECKFAFTEELLSRTKMLLRKHLHIVRIEKLDVATQEELIYWIFDNEDRVWRYRGGRVHETLAQFLDFLPHKNKGTEKCFPGVIVYLHKEEAPIGEHIKISNVVGYAIGEYVNDLEEVDINSLGDVYEIVTAWINPNHRGLQLSTQMYLNIFKSVSSKHVTFDLLNKHTEKVVQSSTLLTLLKKIVGERLIIQHRSQSYDVQTEHGIEQFEKVTINRKPIVIAINTSRCFEDHKIFFVSFFFVFLGLLVRVFI